MRVSIFGKKYVIDFRDRFVPLNSALIFNRVFTILYTFKDRKN